MVSWPVVIVLMALTSGLTLAMAWLVLHLIAFISKLIDEHRVRKFVKTHEVIYADTDSIIGRQLSEEEINSNPLENIDPMWTSYSKEELRQQIEIKDSTIYEMIETLDKVNANYEYKLNKIIKTLDEDDPIREQLIEVIGE